VADLCRDITVLDYGVRKEPCAQCRGSGSGSRRAETTHKSEEISSMKCLMLELKTSPKPKFVNV
jgi:hypothetical protein